MTLISGQLPYNYEHGKGRFHVPNPYSSAFPIGPSGILLEQAQFVITAEHRKFFKNAFEGSNYLDNFFVYVNPIITPSGGYEPKANGSTLGNAFYPAAVYIIDHIHDIRIALNALFSYISLDTNLSTLEYRAAWLQSLYPESPSGFLFGADSDFFSNTIGHWSHRLSSETGIIDYTSPEVLGASGILYDVDLGELMWNPAPHIAAFGMDTMHGRNTGGSNDGFSVQQFPMFPAFQKTDGTLIPLTGREPDVISQASDYQIDHIASGDIRIDGYVLFDDTKLYLGRNGHIFDTSVSVDFNIQSEGLREVMLGGNFSGARVFATPVAQSSGIYRIASKNNFADFPTTTIESGKMSFWPNITSYWPNTSSFPKPYGEINVVGYLGYHVFDDCLWETDVTFSATNTGFCSGLAIMSPWTSHPMWIRYAEQTAVDSIPLAGFPAIQKNWSSAIGLERASANNIYRLHPNPQSDATTSSGQFLVMQFNDMLDMSSSFATTSDSVAVGVVDNFPFGTSTTITINDFWRNDSTGNYLVSNTINVGFDIWKFDSTFKYVNKYIFNPPSGMFNTRGFFMNGNHYLYYGSFGPTGTSNIISSGIYPVQIGAEGTDPYDGSANQPGVGTLWIWPGDVKFINGAPFVGTRSFAEILDIIYVPASTHVIPGVHALVRWTRPDGSFLNDLYLVRIEETATSWEIRGITEIATAYSTPAHGRRDLLYMSY